jgi:hypothetical protein
LVEILRGAEGAPLRMTICDGWCERPIVVVKSRRLA